LFKKNGPVGSTCPKGTTSAARSLYFTRGNLPGYGRPEANRSGILPNFRIDLRQADRRAIADTIDPARAK